MMNAVRHLAIEHDIFLLVEPSCEGWELYYKYRIIEPVYSKFVYQGYHVEVDILSEGSYRSYDDALQAGLEYIKDHSRMVEHNGMITLTK